MSLLDFFDEKKNLKWNFLCLILWFFLDTLVFLVSSGGKFLLGSGNCHINHSNTNLSQIRMVYLMSHPRLIDKDHRSKLEANCDCELRCYKTFKFKIHKYLCQVTVMIFHQSESFVQEHSLCFGNKHRRIRRKLANH